MTHGALHAAALFKGVILALALVGLASTFLAMAHHVSPTATLEKSPFGIETSDPNAK